MRIIISLILLFLFSCKTSENFVDDVKVNDQIEDCPEVMSLLAEIVVLDSLYEVVLELDNFKLGHSDSTKTTLYQDDDLAFMDLMWGDKYSTWLYSNNQIIQIQRGENWSQKKVFDYGNCISKEITIVNNDEQRIKHFDYSINGKCYEVVSLNGMKTEIYYTPIRYCGYPKDSLRLNTSNENGLLVTKKVFYHKSKFTGNDTVSNVNIPIESYLLSK